MDNNELDKMSEEFDRLLKKRNTMTIGEFEEFKPLFKRDMLERMSVDEQMDLMHKYQERVSLMIPVYVVDYSGELLFTLPPVQKTIKTINEVDPSKTLLLNAFVTLNSNNTFKTERTREVNREVKSLVLSADMDDSKEEVVEEIKQDLVEKNILKEDAVGSPISKISDDMEWDEI